MKKQKFSGEEQTRGQIKLCAQKKKKKNLKQAEGKVGSLGVWFCTDQGMKMNFEDKVHDIQDILNKLLAKQETNTSGDQKMFDVMAFTKSLKIA